MHQRGRAIVEEMKKIAEEEVMAKARNGVAREEAEKEVEMVKKAWDMQEEALREHEDVVKRFGRYPHRSGVLGREVTQEEEEWLKTAPGWAKQ